MTNPERFPLGLVAAWLATWLFVVVASLAMALVISYPTGSPTRFGRLLFRTLLGIAAIDGLAFAFRPGPVEGDTPPNNPLGINGAGPVLSGVIETLGTVLALLAILTVLDLAIRFRRARGVERQQFRWFLAAVVAFPVLFLLAIIVEEQLLGNQGFDPVVVIIFLWGNGTAVAIGLAITRHGLYEIDRIISRTVTYGLLTAVVAAVYLGAVSVIGSLLPSQEQLAVAGSTLLAAALINPLRRRIQRGWIVALTGPPSTERGLSKTWGGGWRMRWNFTRSLLS